MKDSKGKKEFSITDYDAFNVIEELKKQRKHPTVEKMDAIKNTLK